MRLRRGRWPLSKGLLVDALLPLGVPTEVAHALAHTVEERLKRLRRKGGVTPRTLRRILLEEVERELGPEKARLLAKQTLPFEEIFVVEGRKQRPFSKGLLTRSLEDAGFSLREAHELAKAVERRLRLEGVRRIPAKRLEKVVAEEARRLYGPEAGERYRARLLYAGELFVEEAPGAPRVPFSKGILAQSLMAIGLSPDRAFLRAYHVAIAGGLSDEAFCSLVRRLDRQVAAVDGHGFTATPDEMRPLGEALAARGFRVEGVRLPGHGTSVEHLAATLRPTGTKLSRSP